MKRILGALALAAIVFAVQAGDAVPAGGGIHQPYANAPVCPEGWTAVRVKENGVWTWICVPGPGG
ncbi:hypothetical protein FHW84_003769 [Dyella sp. SG562]|nr:hypothetical protein [Dyella sp. SG562]NKJ20598.1 hypothetical protein [Dyella sp. SG609]